MPDHSGRTKPVRLALTDAAGEVVAADSAVLHLVQDGEVVESFDMRFTGAGYLAMVRGVPRGTYDLRVALDLDGFEALVEGPGLSMG